jgi:hypothetical protein
LTAAGEEVCAEGFVIGAGEVGGEDAAGRGHFGDPPMRYATPA